MGIQTICREVCWEFDVVIVFGLPNSLNCIIKYNPLIKSCSFLINAKVFSVLDIPISSHSFYPSLANSLQAPRLNDQSRYHTSP